MKLRIPRKEKKEMKKTDLFIYDLIFTNKIKAHPLVRKEIFNRHIENLFINHTIQEKC